MRSEIVFFNAVAHAVATFGILIDNNNNNL